LTSGSGGDISFGGDMELVDKALAGRKLSDFDRYKKNENDLKSESGL
jgi:hypothetical protein